jgi:hypothetical protein
MHINLTPNRIDAASMGAEPSRTYKLVNSGSERFAHTCNPLATKLLLMISAGDLA